MDVVEEIKNRLAIEDVVGEYVELKRAGRNLKGFSPFNQEKTPSFMVSPEKQIWHDFSSGKGGNMFSFVMEMEGLDFKGALELLARKAGVDLGQYRGASYGQRAQLKERLYQALELATKFYQVQFSRNQTALSYFFKERQFTKDTALQFRIGYSPNTGDALVRFLAGKKFTLDELKRAGLSAQRSGRPGDMFRGRLMIPLMDPTGRVIGFTARLLTDEPHAPKYINTPQTLLYDKSRHIFGLHLAKEAIRKSDYTVLVEGNMDVIASHQAGIRQVVATAGTALTEMQLKALSRFSPDVRLAFDQDRAGLQAAERAIPIAAKVGVSLSMVIIPEGKDPDELIRRSPKAWETAVSKPQYALDWLIERYRHELDISSGVGKRQFSDVLLAVVGKLQDSVEQDHYVEVLAKLLHVQADSLRAKLRATGSARRPLKQPKLPPTADNKTRLENIKAQNHLLALAFVLPALRDYLAPLKAEMLPEPPAQALLAFLQKHPEFDVRTQSGQLPKETSEYRKILLLLYEELYKGLELVELRYEAARLQTRLIEQFVKIQKQRIAAELREAAEEQVPRLLAQAKELDALLRKTGENTYGRR